MMMMDLILLYGTGLPYYLNLGSPVSLINKILLDPRWLDEIRYIKAQFTFTS